MVSVAVVGSGISGLICAQTILKQIPEVKVAVYEWGRGPGGRTARRRVSINETSLSFDHAAPFFSSSTKLFRDGILNDWIDRGIALPWVGKFASFSGNDDSTITTSTERFTGVPTMHSICKSLSNDIVTGGGEMLFGRHVLSANFDTVSDDCNSGRWRISANNRFAADKAMQLENRQFDALVLSDKLLVLPNQYAILSEVETGELISLPPLKSEACVVLLLAFNKPAPSTFPGSSNTVCDVLKRGNNDEDKNAKNNEGSDSAVRLIVHESAKPHRDDSKLDMWVVHSGSNYALKRLRPEIDGEAPSLENEDAVKSEMIAEFLQILNNQDSTPVQYTPDAVAYSSVMVWDHAQVRMTDRLHKTHLLDHERRIGVCGDFFSGEDGKEKQQLATGVEAAALSGSALGLSLVPHLEALIAERKHGAKM